MSAMLTRLPIITCALLVLYLGFAALRGYGAITLLVIGASILMFASSWASAIALLGARAARRFVALGVAAGWFAEQMGASHGWFFGAYTYTEVLGPALGDVPVVIPLMWFALCHAGYVIANLIVWQTPADGVAAPGRAAVMALLGALIVTAYDLGADPYMVLTLKAWIMTKTDGWWFGETLQGFVGWVFVSFVILFSFRMSLRRWAPQPAARIGVWPVLVPLLIYGGTMVFQMVVGNPVEIRTIALFAMGIPLLCALLGWSRWRTVPMALKGSV